ncbi:hypothetical protein METHP14_120007 [Pseudomonas sp. P14-2025]
MAVLVPGGEAAVGWDVSAWIDSVQGGLRGKLENAGENRHCQRVGYRSVHESIPPANGPMDLGRLGGDRQELCQHLKNALQALWCRGYRFSVGLYASRWRWAAFPQGWGLGAGNSNPVLEANAVFATVLRRSLPQAEPSDATPRPPFPEPVHRRLRRRHHRPRRRARVHGAVRCQQTYFRHRGALWHRLAQT